MKKLFAVITLWLFLLSACAKVQTPPGTQVTPGISITPRASLTPEASITPEVSVTPEPGDGGEVTPTPHKVTYAVSDFFPLKKNVHMIYKGFNNEYAEFETYVEYIRSNIIQLRNVNPGTSSVAVYQVGKNELKLLYSEGEIYYRHDFTSARNNSEILIKGPIAVGTQWTLKGGATRSITAIDKNISTPKGSFKALEITTIRTDSTDKEYYVRNLGLVKRVSTDKGSQSEVSSELQKIETGVPFKHNVRFFFPDFLNNRIVYIDRNVEIYTNEDMKYKFQKELKTIPQGSELTKVLTSGVQVSSTQLQRDKGMVTVNFSKHLISEMNAGSSLESMIIKSIVDTYGNYYNVDKVIITVEGKPYSSGHILLKPGEYFTVDLSGIVPYK